MFDAYVAFQARLKPRAFALITPQRRATYAELNADVDRFAVGLRELGIGPECGVVSIQIGNGYLTHVVFLALARLGVVSSPSGDPRPDLTLLAAAAAQPGQIALTADWLRDTFKAEARPVSPARWRPDQLARVMLSSGTTRTARRVPRTWAMLEGNTHTAASTYLAGKPGRWVCLTGLDTGLGQAMTLAAWRQGETILADFTPDLLAEGLEVVGPSIIGLTPIYLRRFLAALPPAASAPAGLRIVSTGGVLPPSLAREARLRLGAEILISYGAAETGSSAMANGAWLETHPGAAGYPAPGVRIEIVDETGAPVAAGSAGEVRVFSDRQSDGYLDDLEATAAVFRDGAFYSGDLGRMTAGGLLIVEGRLDDRMDLGVMKFLPDDLEDVALAYPGVLDAAAYATPDESGLSVCWLAVVAAEDFDRQGLARHIADCGKPLPPIRFAWTQAIPRNAMGKIERRRLREETIAVLRDR